MTKLPEIVRVATRAAPKEKPRDNLNIHQENRLIHKFPAANYSLDEWIKQLIITTMTTAAKQNALTIISNPDLEAVKTRGFPIDILLVAAELLHQWPT